MKHMCKSINLMVDYNIAATHYINKSYCTAFWPQSTQVIVKVLAMPIQQANTNTHTSRKVMLQQTHTITNKRRTQWLL